jgi:hypothetical protein
MPCDFLPLRNEAIPSQLGVLRSATPKPARRLCNPAQGSFPTVHEDWLSRELMTYYPEHASRTVEQRFSRSRRCAALQGHTACRQLKLTARLASEQDDSLLRTLTAHPRGDPVPRDVQTYSTTRKRKLYLYAPRKTQSLRARIETIR